jgi:hypothetical protein
MKKVLRLNEQDFSKLIQKIIDMSLGLNKTDSNDKEEISGEKEVSGGKEVNSEKPIGKVSAKGQELLNNPIFKEKLKEISRAINVDESSIIKLMKHESGLNSSIKNSYGCVGLIQFCPDDGGNIKTINGKSYNLDELKNDLEKQMNAIKEFWTKAYNNGKIKRAEDLYIYNFFPIAAGKPDDFVLKAKGLSATEVARANPIFNRKLGKPELTPLTVGGLKDYYRKTGMI